MIPGNVKQTKIVWLPNL